MDQGTGNLRKTGIRLLGNRPLSLFPLLLAEYPLLRSLKNRSFLLFVNRTEVRVRCSVLLILQKRKRVLDLALN